MKTPCELVVKTVLPTMRASIARELVQKHGMKQKEAAEILGVTDAAVSQYLSEKRATKRGLRVFRSKEFEDLVKWTAKFIASSPGEVEAMKAMCLCCSSIRAKKLLCTLHEEMAPHLHNCELCLQVKSGTQDSSLRPP